jgi:hypothetical protein
VSPGAPHWLPAGKTQVDGSLTPSSRCNNEPAPPTSSEQRPDLDEAINHNHMELVIHAMLSDEMFNFAVGFEKFHRAGLALGFETALKAPYLLNQVMAFAACHLAHVDPQRSAFFQRQAVILQTRAVSIFNAVKVEVDASNCVPTLLFSSMLGQHLLADTLSKRDLNGLEGFVAHYVQCVDVHRGIYTIATSAWPLLMETELEPILTMSRNLTSREPTGEDCLQVMGLVESTEGMSEEERESCRVAIRYLQVGLDAVQADDNASISRYQMICEWTMLVPPVFTRLVAAKRSVALIVLAHYAVLLHCGRHLWQVGDAGRYMMGIIEAFLGPNWGCWFDLLRERVLQGDGNQLRW